MIEIGIGKIVAFVSDKLPFKFSGNNTETIELKFRKYSKSPRMIEQIQVL